MEAHLISILIPVLDRPDNAARVVDSIRANGHPGIDTEVVFLCSPGDDDEIHACQETGERVVIVTWDPGHGDFSRKINAGYRVTHGEWVFTGADDLIFHPGWDAEALRTGNGYSLVGTQDLGNPLVKRGRHSTHSLIRRSYIDEVGCTFDDGPGVVLHEGYAHQFPDNEVVHAAMARGEWAFAAESVVEHLHPFFDKTIQRDATYLKGLDSKSAIADARLFRERKRVFDFNRRNRR